MPQTNFERTNENIKIQIGETKEKKNNRMTQERNVNEVEANAEIHRPDR